MTLHKSIFFILPVLLCAHALPKEAGAQQPSIRSMEWGSHLKIGSTREEQNYSSNNTTLWSALHDLIGGGWPHFTFKPDLSVAYVKSV